MTRKDYELIARAFSDKRAEYGSRGDKLIVDDIASELANSLHCTNARFDRVRFLRACGVEV